MNRFISFTGGALFAAALSVSGCKSGPTQSTSTTRDNARVGVGDQALEQVTPEVTGTTKPVADKPPATIDLSAEAQGLTRKAITLYEEIRASLAVDKTDNVPAVAVKLIAAVKAAGDAAPDAAKPHFLSLDNEARGLAKVAGDDAEKIRLAFGEVSRSMVALLSAAPMLAKDYHVFECPMAKGYNRWVQPNAELSNPYMGTRMPTCGDEVKF